LKVIVAAPVQVPAFAVYEIVLSKDETVSAIVGREVFAGTLLATVAVASDVFAAEPRLFVAVTTTRSVEPTSSWVAT
jgi:hypothetical protein